MAESMAATEPHGAKVEEDPRKKYSIQSVLGEWGRSLKITWRGRSLRVG